LESLDFKVEEWSLRVELIEKEEIPKEDGQEF
jgi:hypothetical protein